MPNLVSSLESVVRRLKPTNYYLPTTIYQLLSTNCRRRRHGFSLIELMIVVSLMGIAASLVTASYLNFERNNRVKNAAIALKNDLRLIQNKATSGDKGPKGSVCNPASPAATTLGGWYLLADFNSGSNTYYKIGGDCVIGADEFKFFDASVSEKTINLPKDIKINRIFYNDPPGIDLTLATTVFFRPLNNKAFFHNGTFAPPDFLESDGVTIRNAMPALPQNSAVTIELSDMTSSRKYHVRIEITGEINEAKP